jgi:multidrug efflux pump subunit AcrA (membrane-fusion protein)
MTIRTLIHRVGDFLLTLLPGSRHDPSSFEARIRRTDDFFKAELDRATTQAQRLIDQATVEALRVEKAIEQQAVQALEAAEHLARATADRIARLRGVIGD